VTIGLRSMSLRLRLTLAYTLAIAVLLAVYASGVFLFFRDGLHTQLDRRLDAAIDQGQHALKWAPDGRRVLSPAMASVAEGADPWLEVWSADGSLLYRSALATRHPIEPARPAQDLTRATTARGPGDVFRVRERRATVESRPVLMRAAESENEAHAELARIAWILGLGLPLGAVAAAAAGYHLAKRALAPVDRLARQASAITAERLGERLTVDAPDEELGRLAHAFNATLARLEQSFNEMRRFTSDASHELRTPLTAVRTVGEVGLQEPRSPERYREIIGSMLEEVDRLSQLVDSLLTLSRADAGHVKLARQAIDVASLVDEAVSQLLVLAEEKKQRIVTDVARPLVISADPVLLRRAVSNLLDNAIKYSPCSTAIHVMLSQADREAVLSIRDEGPGIAAADQVDIFDRFFRVDRARTQTSGAGLGLAIARWVVNAHDGRITVESDEGRGSTFRIALPL
jgi:heavy metal sensor kinase